VFRPQFVRFVPEKRQALVDIAKVAENVGDLPDALAEP